MTKREFTEACEKQLKHIYRMAAIAAIEVDYRDGRRYGTYPGSELFVQELLNQDSDEGSRSGTRHMLGEELYAELQKFKIFE